MQSKSKSSAFSYIWRKDNEEILDVASLQSNLELGSCVASPSFALATSNMDLKAQANAAFAEGAYQSAVDLYSE